VELAPNPTSDQVTIGLEKVQGAPFELVIVNQLGQAMFQQKFSENTDRQVTLSTVDFPTGIYFVWLKQEGNRSIPQKLIKQQL